MPSLLFLITLFLPLILNAQWQPGGIPVCDTSANINRFVIPRIAPDGEGGVYVAWQDYRNGNADIYAQRVDSNGNALWTYNGVPLTVAPGHQSYVRIIADGSGGAILAWEDNRTITTTFIYAQRINDQGQQLWVQGGVRVSEKSGLYISMDSDGAGGAVIAWRYLGGPGDDVVVQRLDSLGNTVWGDSGVQVTNRPESVYPGDVWVVSDQKMGAIVSWSEGNRVYSQRVDSLGTRLWQLNGVLVSDSLDTNTRVTASSDLLGGAIVNWANGTDLELHAQRIDSSGMVRWGVGGLVVGVIGGGGGQRCVSDGKGGAFIGHSRFVQHLNRDGSKLWDPSGVPFTDSTVGTNDHSANQSVHTRTSEGGIWVFWQDFRNGVGFHICGQWIDSSGSVRWAATGIPISKVTGYQELPHAISDGFGHGFVVWGEGPVGSGYGSSVYLAKVDTTGVVTSVEEANGGGLPPMPMLHQNYPNPFNPTTTITYDLPLDSKVILKLYDILGREVQTLANENVRAGYHKAILNADNLATGVYFYRIQTERFTNTKTLLLLK